MPAVSPVAWAVARDVLLHETGEYAEPAALAEAAERAYAQLHDRLADLIGSTGYTILVARAVRLAQSENPALEHITVDTGAAGGLRGVYAFAQATDDPGAAAAGLAAILAHVIGLLITFIGDDLALRLVREAWPETASSPVDLEGRA